MENFSINPNINLNQFDNSIDKFNQNFSTQFDSNSKSFDEVFNSFNATQMQPMQASASTYIGIDSINATKIENLSPTAKMANDIGKGFKNGLNQVSSLGKEAEDAFETFATGGDISVHDVMIASQKSGLAMQMAIQLRNQMINAYNEFKNMSI